MPNTDAITTSLLRQLAAHRATLQVLLIQRAGLGSLHAPPGVHNGMAQARAEIAQLKAELRARGEHVDDQPGDDEAESDQGGDELLPPLTPSAELPDLFPIANDLIGRTEERAQLGEWYDALARQLLAHAACLAPGEPITRTRSLRGKTLLSFRESNREVASRQSSTISAGGSNSGTATAVASSLSSARRSRRRRSGSSR